MTGISCIILSLMIELIMNGVLCTMDKRVLSPAGDGKHDEWGPMT